MKDCMQEENTILQLPWKEHSRYSLRTHTVHSMCTCNTDVRENHLMVQYHFFLKV